MENKEGIFNGKSQIALDMYNEFLNTSEGKDMFNALVTNAINKDEEIQNTVDTQPGIDGNPISVFDEQVAQIMHQLGTINSLMKQPR